MARTHIFLKWRSDRMTCDSNAITFFPIAFLMKSQSWALCYQCSSPFPSASNTGPVLGPHKHSALLSLLNMLFAQPGTSHSHHYNSLRFQCHWAGQTSLFPRPINCHLCSFWGLNCPFPYFSNHLKLCQIHHHNPYLSFESYLHDPQPFEWGD